MDNKEKWGLVDDYFSVNGFVFGTEKSVLYRTFSENCGKTSFVVVSWNLFMWAKALE